MKRFVVVGTGGRGSDSFIGPLLKEFPESIEIVGLYDPNPLRMDACCSVLGVDLPRFHDFDVMLDTVQPDGVIVTSVDATHAQYVVKSLGRNIPTFSEKPLCTTVEQVQDIRRAAAASSAKGYVTHNMRFTPDLAVMKRMILEGTIGKVLSIQFNETLDRYHGADYFRRWHGRMAKSAGLLIHKSSHHFDLMNWLANSAPHRVTAQGALSFYGKNGPFHGARCSDCAHSADCWFHADVFANRRAKALYQDAESADGYHRDGCVYDPAIDIYDTMSVSISYANGIVAGYNLIAYASYESMRIAVEGTLGRIELYHSYGTSWAVGHKPATPAPGDTAAPTSLANDGHDARDSRKVTWYDSVTSTIHDVTTADVAGGHGGADPQLRQSLFSTTPAADPLNQRAPLEEGIQAVLVGLAANASIAALGQPIHIPTLAPPV